MRFEVRGAREKGRKPWVPFSPLHSNFEPRTSFRSGLFAPGVAFATREREIGKGLRRGACPGAADGARICLGRLSDSGQDHVLPLCGERLRRCALQRQRRWLRPAAARSGATRCGLVRRRPLVARWQTTRIGILERVGCRSVCRSRRWQLAALRQLPWRRVFYTVLGALVIPFSRRRREKAEDEGTALPSPCTLSRVPRERGI